MPSLPVTSTPPAGEPRTSGPHSTEVGSVFISNYPPFSAWRPEHVPDAERAVNAPPVGDTPLGLYLHVPFCRKRCKFCYFRVYTDKNADDVEQYLDALAGEVALYATLPVMQRPFRFAYFGGGTPSFLSAKQLESLVARLRKSVSWDDAEEVTFECEPGTLQEHKLQAIRDMGVTRLSLGIENFNDAILEENGRAHLSKEVFRAYEWARRIGFPQINIDLIAGMVGETDANWSDCIRRTVEMSPDSVTIYQMELPYNTVYSRSILAGGQSPVADWDTKRRWVREAFDELGRHGYRVSSAYTVVKEPPRDGEPTHADESSRVNEPSTKNPAFRANEPMRPRETSRVDRPSRAGFVYRDALWHGADMLGTGVASFSHVAGVHFQNLDQIEDYIAAIRNGRLPLSRALPIGPDERLIRELILQLKLGRIDAGYFRVKFGVEILDRFAAAFRQHADAGMLHAAGDDITLTPDGLLRVDSLLPPFFAERHRGTRYT